MMRVIAAGEKAEVHDSLDMVLILLEHDCNHKLSLSILNSVSRASIILQVLNETLPCSASVLCTPPPPPMLTSTANVSRLAYGDSVQLVACNWEM